jgi:poly [ADP-ribose] polymerase 2/3/4
MKGKVPIDEYVTLDKSKFHVLEHQGKVYSATLNQTNVSNNNNKFYIIQILQSDDNPNNNYFFCRWGRVGVTGQISCGGPMTIMAAVLNFNSKYREKHDKGDYR